MKQPLLETCLLCNAKTTLQVNYNLYLLYHQFYSLGAKKKYLVRVQSIVKKVSCCTTPKELLKT